MKPRAYVSAVIPARALEALRASCEVVQGDHVRPFEDPAFAPNAADFEAMVVTLTQRIDDAVLARLPRLKVIAIVAVGYDNVDLAACRARGVVVTNTPGVLTEACADLAFGLLLATARRIAEGDRMMRAPDANEWPYTRLMGAAVHGATLGIVGFGRIGQAMARRARGFGMPVLYTQRTRLAPELERALGATYRPIDDLFAEADFVSLHSPLTNETRQIASRARIGRMKKTAFLLNTSRGACVDERALLEALVGGAIAGAGLDVFENEPNVSPEFAKLSSVVLTPHIASAENATRAAMADLAVDNAVAVLRGDAPLTPVV